MSASDSLARRVLRYAWRVPFLFWHLLVDLPVVLLLISLPTRGIVVRGLRLEYRAIRWWSRWLMRVFGIRVRGVGDPLAGPTMFVANHVSWVDIVVLHSQRMMGFVAKREIAGWPLVGWMATKAETIFHQRGSQESLGDVLGVMTDRLRGGHSIGAFPEGGTRGGHQLGPFHARIFTAAVEAGVPVQPVALRYGAHGVAQTRVAFGPRENFLENFLRILGDPAIDADVVFLPPILPGMPEAEGRRRIAETARARIAAVLPGA
ncbi:1-acyl-sn-glycerol-3-phosphate acyltransferase [Lysobacter pythonis]|uniref:1-acyl-sn-glycerol-3-phosphate acyltransferase n=1 Tax=Solilutibacter pythonis TaxID=2483112 RepID=A0A3M2HMK8_9GAMM|nr:lysophospholipid acyltransferase family protein [Lysobacter pythonis]RMH90946.1 1-acyl-sn-glycerol-3-phosphate acyltransferase [Lysobacter pythonis]